MRRSKRLETQLSERVLASASPHSHHQLPSPESNTRNKRKFGQKRKFGLDAASREHLTRNTEQVSDELDKVRLNTTALLDTIESPYEGDNCDPVTYWARHSRWPANYADRLNDMVAEDSNKRSRSTSYTQSVKDGQSPRAHTRAHEVAMIQHSMVMDVFQREAAIDGESIQLCRDLLTATYEPPGDLTHDDYFFDLLQRARGRNEGRVVRDITPWLVPAAELVYIRNKTPGLEHVIEEVGQIWDKGIPIFGPQSKSDYAAGLASSAFTANELKQLKMNHAPESPSNVTDSMFFPFLICEVKCGERSMIEAERQAMQSSSLAIKTIIKLYERVSRASELDQKALVFSVAHDSSNVKLYAHFARTAGGPYRYYRHLIRSFDFSDPEGRDRWTSYNFTRKLYDHFIPTHLGRIQSALQDFETLPSESSVPEQSSDAAQQPKAQVPSSAHLSQGTDTFARPSLPATSVLQLEIERLNNQVGTVLRQLSEQTEEARKERQAKDERMDEVRRDAKEREDKLGQQITDLMALLERTRT